MYNHLLYKGYDIKVGYYGDKEIEFYRREEWRKTIYTGRFKNRWRHSRKRIWKLTKDTGQLSQIVLTEDTFSGNSYEGIRHCPIRQFLME